MTEYEAACRAVARSNDAPAHRCNPIWVARQIADELLRAGFGLHSAIDLAYLLTVELKARRDALGTVTMIVDRLGLGVPESERMVPRQQSTQEISA